MYICCNFKRLFALNYRFMKDKSLIEVTWEIISVSIIHGRVSKYAGTHDIESKIVLNINQGDMKMIAVDLDEREIISIP